MSELNHKLNQLDVTSEYGLTLEQMKALRTKIINEFESKRSTGPLAIKSYMGKVIHISQRPQDGKMW
jgi:hypothetical protein